MSVLDFRRTVWLNKPSKVFTFLAPILGVLILFTILIKEPILLKKEPIYFEILEIIAVTIYVYIIIIHMTEMI